jgi:hypothetical protein
MSQPTLPLDVGNYDIDMITMTGERPWNALDEWAV